MTQTQKRPAVAEPGARNTVSPAQYSIPADRLLPRLDAVRQTGPGRWIARCPAHDDRHPSLAIRELPEGTLLVRCWVGCGATDVVAAAGLDLRDLFPARTDGRSPLCPRERWMPADVLRCLPPGERPRRGAHHGRLFGAAGGGRAMIDQTDWDEQGAALVNELGARGYSVSDAAAVLAHALGILCAATGNPQANVAAVDTIVRHVTKTTTVKPSGSAH